MSESKVICRVYGGLGNQLFSYAAARRLASHIGAELVIDDVSGFKRDFAYKRKYELDMFLIPCRKAAYFERLEPAPRLIRKVRLLFNRFRKFSDRNYIVQEGVDLDLRLLSVNRKRTIYIEGYWQSESYFKDIEGLIRSDLQFIHPSDALNLHLASKIRDSNSVAIHVRFFNSDSLGSNNAPIAYYEKAIAKMESLRSGLHYFLFSDKPDHARLIIPLPDDRVTVITNNTGPDSAFADLWLMHLCKHHIIANSTFSWWGAWLADFGGKIVIAPGFELREGVSWWGFTGLIPQEWIKC